MKNPNAQGILGIIDWENLLTFVQKPKLIKTIKSKNNEEK